MRRPIPQRTAPSKAGQEAQFALWLCGAADERVLAADPVKLARWYGLDPREVETKLLARQDVIRRRRAGDLV